MPSAPFRLMQQPAPATPDSMQTQTQPQDVPLVLRIPIAREVNPAYLTNVSQLAVPILNVQTLRLVPTTNAQR